MRAQSPKKTNASRTRTTHLWLACFFFDRPTKWNGSCQMVVEALDLDDAMRKCHEKFVKLVYWFSASFPRKMRGS